MPRRLSGCSGIGFMFTNSLLREAVCRVLTTGHWQLVGKPGLEPGRLAAHDPKSCSSTSSDTSPYLTVVLRGFCSPLGLYLGTVDSNLRNPAPTVRVGTLYPPICEPVQNRTNIATHRLLLRLHKCKSKPTECARPKRAITTSYSINQRQTMPPKAPRNPSMPNIMAIIINAELAPSP